MACAVALQPAATAAAAAQPALARSGSRLVVVISVDQMRADYLERFRHQFRGGLRQLSRNGAVLKDAHQDHADTETGPGHASLLSGRYPGHTGIIANDWYSRATGKMAYCVGSQHKIPGSDRTGASPELFRGTGLGDWLKAASPTSKVISVSRKDRSAVLMAGRRPDQVYWFDTLAGQFVTSEYYATAYPDWYDAWTGAGLVDSYFGQTWDRLHKQARRYALSDPDTSPGRGSSNTPVFPHQSASKGDRPDAAYYSFLVATPFIDELTLKFAEAALRGEALGQRGVTDLLAIGLSATDAIGHDFGPNSAEIQDQLLRLDVYLGHFLKELKRRVTDKNLIVVLAADHGVMPLPEHLQARKQSARRATAEFSQLNPGLEAFLDGRFGEGNWVEYGPGNGGVYFNYETARERSLSLDRIIESAAEYLRQQPTVETVYTRQQLESREAAGDKFLRQFRNSYDPERTGDLQIRFPAQVLFRARGTTHGTPYTYDTHIPIIFLGPPFRWGTYAKRAASVDIAPTLARVLGIEPGEVLDGRVLEEILKR